MIVFELTPEDIQYLHDATDHSYFKDDGEGNFVAGSLGGAHIFGVDKFVAKFPDVDISGLTQIEYVPEEDNV
jgi:hypothetical protein